jgi:hypothetical protein
MFACSYGAAFGAIQQVQEIIPGLADVKAKTTHKLDELKEAGKIPANMAQADDEAKKKAGPLIAAEKAKINTDVNQKYTKMQEIGGLIGRFVFAFLATRILSQRSLLRVFQVPGLIVVPLVFFFFLTIENKHFFDIPLEWMKLGSLPVTTMSLGLLLAGFFTVAQFSFWGNYLPRVYPLHLRGTGESFAANIGGRMLGTSFAFVTTTLVKLTSDAKDTDASQPARFAVVAAGVALFVYLVGFLASFWLPEPKADLEQ